MRVTLRFYAELNDFVAPHRRGTAFGLDTPGPASVKDLVEGCGVPHTEVDLVLVNEEPVDFRHVIRDGDRVAVYPVFESFDIAAVTRVRPEPLRDLRFVVDVHLGRLARYLRLAGFDTSYPSEAGDAELARISSAERRVLLTRDQALLKRGAVTHGYYVRETNPARQLSEIIRRFDLRRAVRPFTRCTCCNGPLEAAETTAVAAEVPARSRRCHDVFLRCAVCRRVYWRGSHALRLERILADAVTLAETGAAAGLQAPGRPTR